MQETWVQFLAWEDPLEEGMATHPSILTWRIPWTEESGGLQSRGSQIEKLIWVHYYELNSSKIFTNAVHLLQNPIYDMILHLIITVPLSSLVCDIVSWFSQFLMSLAVLRSTGQIFYKMPLNWGLFHFFFTITGIMNFFKINLFILIGD